jgi:lipid-binding SYLF domain-containing protein
MRHDRKLARLLGKARGVLLIPHYGRGGIGIGGAGGEGLLLVRRKDDWYGPVFYRVGGINVGIQLGFASGSMAMLLMNDKTVANFEKKNSKWSLSADAALKVVKFGGDAENTGSYGDVVLWSQLKGLYGGLSLGTNNITVDADSDHRYYHHDMRPRQILSGSAPDSHAQRLHAALAGTATTVVAAKADTPPATGKAK